MINANSVNCVIALLTNQNVANQYFFYSFGRVCENDVTEIRATE